MPMTDRRLPKGPHLLRWFRGQNPGQTRPWDTLDIANHYGADEGVVAREIARAREFERAAKAGAIHERALSA
jgi:hypothetical protein